MLPNISPYTEEAIMARSSTSTSKTVKLKGKELCEFLKPDLTEIVQESLNDYIADGVRLLLELLMQAEAQLRCGDRHERNGKREASRWGTEKGTGIVFGQTTSVERPRLRNGRKGSTEVQLETYRAMNKGQLLDDRVISSVLAGVSTRRYASTIAKELRSKGVSKSSVSRRAIAATKPTVEEFLKRRLDQHDLLVLMFDGIHVARKQMVVCIGIDMSGRKRVLGMRVGATENEIVCRDLIRDMIERGLDAEKNYLFAIDGSKALVQAIRAAFGQDAQIQRCQEHKIRDVQGYVPVKLRAPLRKKIQAAYDERTEKAAYARLSGIRLELLNVSEKAANALAEGLYETLTVHRLGVTGLLRASLRTTNVMESAFSSVRRYMGRVTKFKDEAQIELWITRSILEAERHFRAVPGYRQIAKLRSRLAELKR
jgi:putative transposase